MNVLYDFIISINDRIIEVLKKPLDRFIDFCEPFWNFLVKHDKYVYLFLALFLIIGACL